MKILNLSNKKESDISFEITNFPDGQRDLFIDETHVEEADDIEIVSRFNSFSDLELISCAANALRNKCVTSISLCIPYLLGARSDRKFASGGVSYLVQVIAPVLNSFGFKRISCMDVHSNVAAACIRNLVNISSLKFITDILKDKKNYVLVCPDAGAHERVYNAAKALHYSKDVVICSKKRDASTGRIISTDIGGLVDIQREDVYIVDDICDGGNTFIQISKKMILLNPGKINLIVTHGIFSAGVQELSKYFNKIYCTNSVSDMNPVDLIEQTKVI